jgi:hypothetical protein
VAWKRGGSLVELVVALVLLELAGAAALAGALTADRLGRRASRGAASDIRRWEEYRGAETALACRAEPMPRSAAIVFPATPERDSLTVAVRCGP